MNLSSKSQDPTAKDGVSATARREKWVAGVLVFCIAIVGFWEVMAHRSDRSFSPFEVTASDFVEFVPQSSRWDIESLPVSPDPVEPNILMYFLRPQAALIGSSNAPSPVVVRLVHGYNLVDCAREKGDTVELLASTRTGVLKEGVIAMPQEVIDSGRRIQVWRVLSATGDASIWVSSMLRAGDFSATNVDTREMPFPRLGIPDNTGWTPRGMTREGLRHPIQGMKKFIQHKWNGSRADLLTFLELKQEAWASEDQLTLVALSSGRSVAPEDVNTVLLNAFHAHVEVHEQLMAWRAAQTDPAQDTHE